MRWYDDINDEIYEIPDDLPTKEVQILILTAEGRGERREAAAELGISPDTVRDYVARLCERFDCRQRDLPAKVLGRSPGSEEENVDFGRILRAMSSENSAKEEA